jgi:hypothetical protein
MHYLGHLAAILAITTFVCGAPQGPSIENHAWSSCSDFAVVDGLTLQATCADREGGTRPSSLYLGNCFVNDYGTLRVCLLNIYLILLKGY